MISLFSFIKKYNRSCRAFIEIKRVNRIFIQQYFLFVSWNVKIWPTAQHLYLDDKTPTFIFLKKVTIIRTFYCRPYRA